MSQPSAYERFRALHEQNEAFIMPNAWDAASAKLLQRAGFLALGTSSFAIAAALGRPDGMRALSLAESVENAVLLGRVTGLPVNGDLEDGFGPSPEDCVATVETAIAAGLGGLGIEDTTAEPGRPIHGFDHAVARMRAAVAAAKGRILLTGRTDLLLHGHQDLNEVIRRLTAFADLGADVLYAPNLPDMDAIRAVVRAVAPKPVNVLIGPGVSLAELSAAGVRRVSLGAALFRAALGGLAASAEAMLAGDLATAVSDAVAGRAFL